MNKIEQKLSFLAIPNLTRIIVTTQVILYIFMNIEPKLFGVTVFIPEAVLQGELWRILTFLFIPPASHPLILLIAWYFFIFIGNGLENEIGSLRYTLFVLVGWIATVVFALVAAWFSESFTVVSNAFLMTSIFLGFARYNPDLEILLFFILPIKIKYIAYFTWLTLFIPLFMGPWPIRFAILATIVNYILFFGKEHYKEIRYHSRRAKNSFEDMKDELTPNHRCVVCGRTDKSNPELDFRYCSKCKGNPCYCEEHLGAHEHIS